MIHRDNGWITADAVDVVHEDDQRRIVFRYHETPVENLNPFTLSIVNRAVYEGPDLATGPYSAHRPRVSRAPIKLTLCACRRG